MFRSTKDEARWETSVVISSWRTTSTPAQESAGSVGGTKTFPPPPHSLPPRRYRQTWGKGDHWCCEKCQCLFNWPRSRGSKVPKTRWDERHPPGPRAGGGRRLRLRSQSVLAGGGTEVFILLVRSDGRDFVWRETSKCLIFKPTSECQRPSSGRDPDPPYLSQKPRGGVARLTEYPAGRYFRYQRQPRRIPPAWRGRKENLRQESPHPWYIEEMSRYLYQFFTSSVFLYLILPMGWERESSECFPDVERHLLPYKSDQKSEPSLWTSHRTWHL